MNTWREREPSPIHVRQPARILQSSPGREHFESTAWGYFEGCEILVPQPIPMQYHDRIEIIVEARFDGQPMGQFRVWTLHRNVGPGWTR